MPKYDRPLNQILISFVKDKHIQKGEIIERQEILFWLDKNYPGFSKSTVDSYLTKMSTNVVGRLHHKVNKGEDDIFFKLNPSQFRLYDNSTDELPIYENTHNTEGHYPNSKVEKTKTVSTDIIEEGDDSEELGGAEFAYERDLKNYLVKNLHTLESGLTLYQDEDQNITGIEYPAGGRYIDILAVDAKDNLVVIELKVSRGYDRTIGQILRYIAWIEKDLAQAHQSVRGIIIANNISNDLLLATSKIKDVELYEYKLSFTVQKIKYRSEPNA